MIGKLKFMPVILTFAMLFILNAGNVSAAQLQPLRPDNQYNLLGAHYTGAGVYQASGTTPTLTAKYTSASPSDPWRGGTFNINWSDRVRLGVGSGQLVTSPVYGFAFVAHVNLPQEVTADQVLAGMDFSTANLTIGDTPFKLKSDNFEKIGDHTLRLTLRTWNASNLLSGIYKLLTSGKFSLDNLYVNFNVNVDVAKMTADGNSLDTSPNKVLTTGMFPPAKTKKSTISVDFYGADQLVEGSGFGGFSPTGRLYANLNSDGSFVTSNRSTATYASWNSYISPWDNQKEYNTNTDNSEVVSGGNANLPGSVGQRMLIPKLALGTYQDIDTANPTRFDRVVNFFTKENVTKGASLTHTPHQTNGLNTTTSVIYSGTDADNTPLSPVTMLVDDAHQDNATIKVTNLTNNVSSTGQVYGTVIPANTNYPVDFQWTAPYLKTGQIRYRILDTSGNPVKGFEDQPLLSIKNTKDYSSAHQETAKVPQLPEGQYFYDFKIIDDYDPDNAQWNYSNPSTRLNTPILTVTDIPQIEGSATLKNTATGEIGSSVTGYSGNQIQEKIDYTFKTAGGKPLSNQRVTIGIPTNTTYNTGSVSVTLNGNKLNNVKPSQTNNTITLPINHNLTKEDQLEITFSYTINQISNTVINTIPAKFDADVAFDAGLGTTVPISPIVSPSQTINVPKEELTLVSVPSDLNFGNTIVKPYIPVDVPYLNQNFDFDVRDTRSSQDNWQISASLSKVFQTSDGQILPKAEVLFDNGKTKMPIQKDSTTPIYSYTGTEKGDIKVDLTKQAQIYLHLEPDASIQTGKTYSGEVDWQLTNGPAS